MLPFKVIFLIFKFPCVEGSPERYNSFLHEKKKNTRDLIAYCPLAGEKGRNVVLKKNKTYKDGYDPSGKAYSSGRLVLGIKSVRFNAISVTRFSFPYVERKYVIVELT